MNDQIENLKPKNIKAVAITSGLTFSEQDVALDNCIYGNYKFLYLSERLENEMVKSRLQKMTINQQQLTNHIVYLSGGINFDLLT